MYQLKPFLAGYDTILLDLDGVVTGEEVYWNTAALTVWELLFSKQYFGTEKDFDASGVFSRLPEIRKRVFCDDAVIKTVKTRGVNNNWDLAWLVTSGSLILQTHNFEAVYDWLKKLPDTAAEMFAAVAEQLCAALSMPSEEAAHQGGFWRKLQFCFQEWFLGSELFPLYWEQPTMQAGKPGLTFGEEPIVDKEKLLALFALLAENKRLGIGTGRPRVEMQNPLKRWNALSYFTPEAIVTHNEVQKAQQELRRKMPDIVLTKPHPYIFLKGIFGDLVPDEKLVSGDFDKAPCKKTLVIGDAACDLLAAKAAGCDFLAVLTGVDGENARSYFEKEKAEYILHNILELLES